MGVSIKKITNLFCLLTGHGGRYWLLATEVDFIVHNTAKLFASCTNTRFRMSANLIIIFVVMVCCCITL